MKSAHPEKVVFLQDDTGLSTGQQHLLQLVDTLHMSVREQHRLVRPNRPKRYEDCPMLVLQYNSLTIRCSLLL